MVKTTKRSRKFDLKGGVKSALEKGTITKKGKLRKKKRTTGLSDADKAAMEARNIAAGKMAREATEKKRNDSDFVGEGNLGDLDMDQFLSSVVEDDLDDKVVTDDGDGDEDSVMDGSDDDSSDDEDNIMDGVDSDEEDVEAVEEQMKADMAKLAESDPDFHKYLADNESSLLEYDNDDIAEVDDDDDEDDEDEDGTEDPTPKPKKPKQPPKDNRILVSAPILQSYERSAFTQHSIKALKRILAAYRSACHMADANDPEED